MQLYIQIDAATVFKAGDIVANDCEVCKFCDGDRSRFENHAKIVLRPIESEAAVTEQRKLLAAKLRVMAEELLR